MKKWLIIINLLLILLLGYRLRSFSYSQVPLPGENADEYAYAWLGMSILSEGEPEAWSQFPEAYQKVRKERINVDGIYDTDPDTPLFTLAKPWFDSPPLIGLITGGYAYLKGAREYDQATVILLRRPVIKLSLVTILLVYLLAQKLYGKKVGLFSALLYALIPLIVIVGRLAIPENGLVVTFLASTLAALYYFETKNIRWWKTACALAAITFFFKFAGIASMISLFLLALKLGKDKRKALAKEVVIASVVTAAIYVLYGALFGWKEFIGVFLAQSNRFYGASSEAFFQAFTSGKVTKSFTDGWINLAWVASFMLIYKRWQNDTKIAFLALPLFSYFVVFLILGSEAYGHYRIPFYPFLIISLAKVLYDLYRQKNTFLFTAGLSLPFGTSLHRLIGVVGFQEYVPIFRIIIALTMVIFAFSLINKRYGSIIQKALIISMFVLTITLSVAEIYFFNIDKWYFAT